MKIPGKWLEYHTTTPNSGIFPEKARYWDFPWLKKQISQEEVLKKQTLIIINLFSMLSGFILFEVSRQIYGKGNTLLILYSAAYMLLLGLLITLKTPRLVQWLYIAVMFTAIIQNFITPIFPYYYALSFLAWPVAVFLFFGVRRGMAANAFILVAYIVLYTLHFLYPELVLSPLNGPWEFVFFLVMYLFILSFSLPHEIIKDREKRSLYRSRVYDDITGLPHRYLIDYIVEPGNQVYIAIVSIRNLKHIGIIMGYDFLTEVTVTIAGILKDLQRKHEFSLYRLTKGEFGIVIESNETPELKRIGDRTVRLVSEVLNRMKITRDQLFAYADIEIGSAIGRVENISALLSEADQSTIREHFFLSQAALVPEGIDVRSGIIRDQEKYDLLLANIMNNSMEVHYQPIVDLLSGEIIFHEALLRLKDAKGTLISVYPYLQVAKNMGLYPKLTEFMLREVFAKIDASRDSCFSVNISIDDIENDDFIGLLTLYKEFLGANAHRIHIEITETDIATHSAKMKDFIEYVDKNNLSIAIDDFGTGYSNFTRFADFHPHLCKIDGEFFLHASKNPLSATVLRSIVDLCRNINIKTVAENIEHQEHLDFAMSLDIDYGQGFLFSRPAVEVMDSIGEITS